MNKSLPIFDFQKTIVDAVKKNQVVIITAETGAGKSTQVPQFFLEEGYNLVVTQPRRLAARTVSARVAEEIGEELGGTVGFRTAFERNDSEETCCLFCTDGLALVRELMGVGKHNVLVLDEVHEWNLNIETLVAWTKLQLKQGAAFKVVLMSATVEAEKLSAYFNNAPVITVLGRQFPVEEKTPGYKLVSDVVSLLRAGRNVLVFQPGKDEIGKTVAEVQIGLEDMKVEVLALHGEQSPEEQNWCFKKYEVPKCVVSTNVAQTSVTIDDIDAVVDSGLERRVELVDGVEGLYLKPISLADREQRKGRAGRCKPGIYIDHCNSDSRPQFPKAEILRSRLDQTVLRLAISGIDAEALEFFHQPSKAEIADAKHVLKALGCMDNSGAVTKIGRAVSQLPISVSFGRMIVEAEKLGVVDDLVSITAILEKGGITARGEKDDFGGSYPPRFIKNFCPGETESDVLAQLAAFKGAKGLNKDEMMDKGIFVKAYFKACEIRQKICDGLRGRVREFKSSGKRENIVRAVCAGMVDHLYRSVGYGEYQNGGNGTRQLNRDSVVKNKPEWIVGIPFDLEIKTRRGKTTLHMVNMATKVDPVILAEVAPQLVELKQGLNPQFDLEKDSVVSTTQIYFNGQLIKEVQVADSKHPSATRVFAEWLAGRSELSGESFVAKVIEANAKRQRIAKDLNDRAGENVFHVYSWQELSDYYLPRLKGAVCLAQIADPDALCLDAFDREVVAKISCDNPDQIVVLGCELPVVYSSDTDPMVTLGNNLMKDNIWINLPNDGIFLPGGRKVAIRAYFSQYEYALNTNIPALKDELKRRINQEQWENCEKQPSLGLPPNPDDELAEIPEITAFLYGKCVVTGSLLFGYGVMDCNSNRWYSNDPYFKAAWYQDWKKAETARIESVNKLEWLKAEAVRNKKVQELKIQAEAVLAKLCSLYDAYCYGQQGFELPRKLYERLEEKRYRSADPSEYWIETTNALINEVEAFVDSELKAKQEKERKEQLAEDRMEKPDPVCELCGKVLNEQFDAFHECEETDGCGFPQIYFQEKSKKHFLCSCGCMERVSSSDWKLYEAGQAIIVTCSSCGVSAQMQKKVDQNAEVAEAKQDRFEASLQALKGRFAR